MTIDVILVGLAPASELDTFHRTVAAPELPVDLFELPALVPALVRAPSGGQIALPRGFALSASGFWSPSARLGFDPRRRPAGLSVLDPDLALLGARWTGKLAELDRSIRIGAAVDTGLIRQERRCRHEQGGQEAGGTLPT